ncbi:MAG: hypothetical protein HPY69_18100 [Armatimonadetes bacterium]|nr:hypothetical protein [Armatimonadota bacterium]
MVVDRPFLCAIRDNGTGAVLFLDVVTDPQELPGGSRSVAAIARTAAQQHQPHRWADRSGGQAIGRDNHHGQEGSQSRTDRVWRGVQHGTASRQQHACHRGDAGGGGL